MILDIEAAKRQVRRIDDDDDERIVLALDQASVVVLDYLKMELDVYENDDGDSDYPVLVAAAVLLVMQCLYETPEKEPLTDAVKSILHRQRDPALA
jgi:hypothetical protein